jgi:hypothetical protein
MATEQLFAQKTYSRRKKATRVKLSTRLSNPGNIESIFSPVRIFYDPDDLSSSSGKYIYQSNFDPKI